MVNYQPERLVIAGYLMLSVLGQPSDIHISKGLVEFFFVTLLFFQGLRESQLFFVDQGT